MAKSVKVEVMSAVAGDSWDGTEPRSDIVVAGTATQIVVDFSRAAKVSEEKTLSFISEVLTGARPRSIRVTIHGNRLTLDNLEGYGTVAVAEAIRKSAEKATLEFQQEIMMPEALLPG